MNSTDLLTWIIGVTFTLLFFIAIIVVVILAARRQKILRDLNESQYRSRLNEVSFSALRAQMNPHFIFNCLNSIKLYTEQNNNTAASEYIDKFSRLIRNMLDNARTGTTTLSAEIETLTLYLDMEQMRFKDKLQYQIVVDRDIDADFIEIPPLLIQPYVENSIWHGVMHKDTTGKVTITIQQDEHENALLISVEDDGIGRAKAAQLKSKGNITHRSHGTQITADRIALLNAKDATCASVNIADLFDALNQPKGTLVTLKLSMECPD